MKHKRVALISFDVEEFDLPREHGGEISLEEGVKVSTRGLERVLKVLKKYKVRATFFVTGNYAMVKPEMIKEILARGHEVACHGVDHFEPKKTDIYESKKIVEEVAGVEVTGYRQPRMFEISYAKLRRSGYKYDSSVNPAFVPGRYNHFDVPRDPFMKEGVLEIPTSVATGMRVPLFWLALHLFFKRVYLRLAVMAAKKTGYFATYFHPWEFSDELKECKEVPFYIKRNSGEKLAERLGWLIENLKKQGFEFKTYDEFAEASRDALDKS